MPGAMDVPVQLAPDGSHPYIISPSKHLRAPHVGPAQLKSNSIANRTAIPTTRIPFAQLQTLAPTQLRATELLPDGGRGSPVKSTNFYPPPPTFASDDLHVHLSTLSRPRSHPQTNERQHAQPSKQTKQAQQTFKKPRLPSKAAAAAASIAAAVASPVAPASAPAPTQVDTDVQDQENISPDEPVDAADIDLVVDDGSKPPYSYATLIGMAILRHPSRKLTLSAIYAWISDSFSYYSNSDSGWQNSIRHNLSLNKAFVKVERPKDEPGKGHYWTVEVGCEGQFVKGRGAKRLGGATRVLTTQPRKDSPKARFETDTPVQMKQPLSAATASINKNNKRTHLPSPSDTLPPKPKRQATTSLASPPLTDDKRKQASVWDYDDSGYFSPTLAQFTEADFDSADHSGSSSHLARSEMYSRELSYSATALDLVLSPPPSSSPQRLERSGGLLGPFTPAAAQKKLIMASPNTSLREHRQQMLQMLASPENDFFLHDYDDDPWLLKTPRPIASASTPKAKSALTRTPAPVMASTSSSATSAAVAGAPPSATKSVDVGTATGEDPWDGLADRAAFGSPEKRESRRREIRRSLVCGLHAQELYETGFEVSDMPGIDILSVMKREIELTKSKHLKRPALGGAGMERSQSSLF